MIRFASPDNFQTGDAVKYNALGNTLISSAINQTSTYYVRVIDPYTIELFDTLAEAKAPAKQFDPSAAGAVSGQTITLPGHGFTNGEAMTYYVAGPGGLQQRRSGRRYQQQPPDQRQRLRAPTTSTWAPTTAATSSQPDNFVTGEKVTYRGRAGQDGAGRPDERRHVLDHPGRRLRRPAGQQLRQRAGRQADHAHARQEHRRRGGHP